MSKNKITKKIFFITSNSLKLNKDIEYSLIKSNGIQNLKAGNKGEYIKEIIHSHDKFITTICSFEIIPSELSNDIKDFKTKLYKAVIKLKYDKTFEGNIFFKNNKNNFIYDFTFNKYIGWTREFYPPPCIKFTKYEQFKIFLNYLKEKEILINEELGQDLIQDSINCLIEKKYSIDFFMEIFKACYSQKVITSLIKLLKVEKFGNPIDFNYKDYLPMINLIDKNPKIIMRHYTEKDDSFMNNVKLYCLIFYLRRKYDKEKAEQMITNKDLYQYFADFLPKYNTFFSGLICPEELIDQMFKGKLTLDKITKILCYTSGVEQILYYINKYVDNIKNCVLNEKKILIMSKIGLAQEMDNLDNIYEEISHIITYETHQEKTLFLSFDNSFWDSYIQLNNDLKNLITINKAIKICSEIEKDLSSDKLGLNEKIHNIGIELAEKGQLKNENLLDFIKIDSYFYDRNKEKKFYRPLTIFKGLDFETMTDNFFEKWKNSNIFIIYNFQLIDFKSALVELIDDVKYFGKLLRLFDYKNNKIFDNHTINILRAKFKNIVKTYKKETCPDFVKDIAYYIYIT